MALTIIPGVYPTQHDAPRSDQDNYFADDGWSIETVEKKLVFCCVDPGHGGASIRIDVKREALNFAQANKPTWNQMCGYLQEQGYW